MEDKITIIELQGYLPWHKARIKCLDLLIISLIRKRTVSYTKNAVSLNEKAICSNLRQIQRLFAEFAINFDLIARLLMAIFPLKRHDEFSLDRTNWQFAGVNFNILCLTIVAEGAGLPIL